MEILEKRSAKVPSFSIDMLREKVFGRFESDTEFQLVHLAMKPLYAETFDPNAALQSVLSTVHNAEAHSEFSG